MRYIIYPFSMDSESSELLRDTIRNMGKECIRVYRNKGYVPKSSDLIIDWGYSREPDWTSTADSKGSKILNRWSYVINAVDKRHTFTLFKEKEVSIPDFTCNYSTAKKWVGDGPVVQRMEVASSKGKGASVIRKPGDLSLAPLYTKLIDKSREFRVHVFKNDVIDIHEKRFVGNDQKKFELMVDTDDWEWTRQGAFLSVAAKQEAVKAIKALGLDFGGVDLILEKGTSKPYVLEVNTAPWLGVTNAKRYAGAFIGYAN